MTIYINCAELLFNVKSKSHEEVALLPAEQRYAAEASTEKENTVKRCIYAANGEMLSLLDRFCQGGQGDVDADVLPGTGGLVLPTSFTYDFVYSERRLKGKNAALAEMMLALLTELTLARFYISVAQTDLAQSHEALAQRDANTLAQMLYTKRSPEI